LVAVLGLLVLGFFVTVLGLLVLGFFIPVLGLFVLLVLGFLVLGLLVDWPVVLGWAVASVLRLLVLDRLVLGLVRGLLVTCSKNKSAIHGSS
jgi:hypothetical protein